MPLLSGVPTITLGSGAGTGATISNFVGVDDAFAFTLTTGSSPPASSLVFTATYSVPLPTGGGVPIKSNHNANAGALYGVSDIWLNGSTGTALNYYSNTTPLTANTSYRWGIIVGL